MAQFERIVKILMERDGVTREDAIKTVERVADMIQDAMCEESCTLSEIDDIISSELGLEPDFVDDFLI